MAVCFWGWFIGQRPEKGSHSAEGSLSVGWGSVGDTQVTVDVACVLVYRLQWGVPRFQHVNIGMPPSKWCGALLASAESLSLIAHAAQHSWELWESSHPLRRSSSPSPLHHHRQRIPSPPLSRIPPPPSQSQTPPPFRRSLLFPVGRWPCVGGGE